MAVCHRQAQTWRNSQTLFEHAIAVTKDNYLAHGILAEAVAVARADGAHLADDESMRTLSTLLTYPPEAGTSMYFDRLAGRSLEVEALTGAIVAAGARLKIATPINSALLAMLRAISDAAKT